MEEDAIRPKVGLLDFKDLLLLFLHTTCHFGEFLIEPVHKVFCEVRLDRSLKAVEKDFSVQLSEFNQVLAFMWVQTSSPIVELFHRSCVETENVTIYPDRSYGESKSGVFVPYQTSGPK